MLIQFAKRDVHCLVNLFFFVILHFYSIAQSNDSTELQKSKRNWVFENNFYFGKIVKNYPVFPALGWAYLNECNIAIQTNGEKYWHKHYFYPQIGVGVLYGSTGNPEVIGSTFSLYPTFTIATKPASKNTLLIRMGLGVAYFSKTFHPIYNSENLLIGSSVTGSAMASLNYKISLNSKNAISFGLATYHFSNGHYQIPNVGINIIALNAGWHYIPNVQKQVEKTELKMTDRKLSYHIQGGFGVHEFAGTVSATGGAKYPVYLGGLFVSKRFSAVNSVQLGLFGNYHTGFYDYITSHDFYSTHQRRHAFTGVFFLGHEFLLGKFAFVTQGGLYWYNPFKKAFLEQQLRKKLALKNYLDLVSTNKMGFKYYFKNYKMGRIQGLYSGIYIKANFGQADFVEYSCGFVF